MNGLVASKTKRESPIILVNIDCELLLAKLATQIAIIIIVDHIKVVYAGHQKYKWFHILSLKFS